MISLAEYEALEETLHLLRDPANTECLLRSIREAEAGSSSSMISENEALAPYILCPATSNNSIHI